MSENENYGRERQIRLARARYRKKMKKRRIISFIVIIIIVAAVIWLAATAVIKASKAQVSSSAVSDGASAVSNSQTGTEQNDGQSSSEPSDAQDSGTAQPTLYEKTWSLILVNNETPLPDGYTVETGTLPNGKEFDERAIFDLTAMLDAAAADGCPLMVCSAYRSVDYQEGLLTKKINEYTAAGYSYDDAYAIATTIVAKPGYSEHNTGLAADIVSQDYQILDDGFENTAQFEWLSQHAAEYGFILRYPKDKQDITGIIYEPWHYRYVGKEYAQQISESGLCFEEWYAQNVAQ